MKNSAVATKYKTCKNFNLYIEYPESEPLTQF
jgi:hypothetical protein